MATLYTIHPDTPQTRIIEKVKHTLQEGGIMLYPTDTVYAIGCDLNSKTAITRVRQIKQLSNDKPLTFLCPSLSNIAQYAMVSDDAYRIMRRLIPGPYTFLLPATRLVPKLVMNPKRKTTGIRVPAHPICQALLDALDNPIISTSANPINEVNGELAAVIPASDRLEKAELFDCFENLVDVIIDDGLEPQFQVSTILDFSDDEPVVVRRGLGWEMVESWLAEEVQ